MPPFNLRFYFQWECHCSMTRLRSGKPRDIPFTGRKFLRGHFVLFGPVAGCVDIVYVCRLLLLRRSTCTTPKLRVGVLATVCTCPFTLQKLAVDASWLWLPCAVYYTLSESRRGVADTACLTFAMCVRSRTRFHTILRLNCCSVGLLRF